MIAITRVESIRNDRDISILPFSGWTHQHFITRKSRMMDHDAENLTNFAFEADEFDEPSTHVKGAAHSHRCLWRELHAIYAENLKWIIDNHTHSSWDPCDSSSFNVVSLVAEWQTVTFSYQPPTTANRQLIAAELLTRLLRWLLWCT